MLCIPATISSPEVSFDQDTSCLALKGESYPENSFEFFAPLFSWLESDLPRLKKLRLEINIPYMNSSSTKCILDIFDLLAEHAGQGNEVTICWYYEEGNDRALELANEFSEDLPLPFETIPFRNEEG
ncbi:MAG: DUF1987 domain-containing protein [Spirochaetes bacterium]|nr:DUF1987 domain-containing protein [Spirochaetota bacterium]MBU0957017.1 DUF1987 domain-containing protein [Spirochaetota bacterium]